MVVASSADACFAEVLSRAEATCEARVLLSDLFEASTPEATLHDLHLLTTELVTNAVVHARPGEIQLLAERVGTDGFRVSITDPGSLGIPHVEELDPEAPGGMGLYLVEQISSCWGVERLEGGENRVWFELEA